MRAINRKSNFAPVEATWGPRPPPEMFTPQWNVLKIGPQWVGSYLHDILGPWCTVPFDVSTPIAESPTKAFSWIIPHRRIACQVEPPCKIIIKRFLLFFVNVCFSHRLSASSLRDKIAYILQHSSWALSFDDSWFPLWAALRPFYSRRCVLKAIYKPRRPLFYIIEIHKSCLITSANGCLPPEAPTDS